MDIPTIAEKMNVDIVTAGRVVLDDFAGDPMRPISRDHWEPYFSMYKFWLDKTQNVGYARHKARSTTAWLWDAKVANL